jgi:hypothetical protein
MPFMVRKSRMDFEYHVLVLASMLGGMIIVMELAFA